MKEAHEEIKKVASSKEKLKVFWSKNIEISFCVTFIISFYKHKSNLRWFYSIIYPDFLECEAIVYYFALDRLYQDGEGEWWFEKTIRRTWVKFSWKWEQN